MAEGRPRPLDQSKLLTNLSNFVLFIIITLDECPIYGPWPKIGPLDLLNQARLMNFENKTIYYCIYNT